MFVSLSHESTNIFILIKNVYAYENFLYWLNTYLKFYIG